MMNLALPSRLRVGVRMRSWSFCETEDFSVKRVAFWTLVFVEAFFVGALLGRAFSMLKM
jgi:hypothetical protein